MRLDLIDQTAWAVAGQNLVAIRLPAPSSEVVPGVQWGCVTELFTPAFWKYHSTTSRSNANARSYRLGTTILEEVAVCMLGGYGMPAELALAAFYRLRDRGLLNDMVSPELLEEALSEPFQWAHGQRRYRFPRQKSKYLWHAVKTLSTTTLPDSARPLRDFLINIPGIGPKTASWIVRNHLQSDEVAILDVHIIRAGKVMSLFPSSVDLSKEYFKLEDRFLQFCAALQEPASLIDALMWDYMRRMSRASIKVS